MAIENRNLEQGMKLTAKFKKQGYTAEVVEAERDDVAGSKDEGLRIKLADGRVFRSVSSAAKAVTGGAINGWRFWSLDSKPATEEASEQQPAEPAQAEPAPEQPAEPEAPKPARKPRAKAAVKQTGTAKPTKKARTPKAR